MPVVAPYRYIARRKLKLQGNAYLPGEVIPDTVIAASMKIDALLSARWIVPDPDPYQRHGKPKTPTPTHMPSDFLKDAKTVVARVMTYAVDGTDKRKAVFRLTPGASALWDFGDGTAPVRSKSHTIGHTFGAPGAYSVSADAPNAPKATRTNLVFPDPGVLQVEPALQEDQEKDASKAVRADAVE